jgi:hypothetical protein
MAGSEFVFDENNPPKHILALFSYDKKFGADATAALLKSYGVETVGELDPKLYESFYDDCCRAIFAGESLATFEAEILFVDDRKAAQCIPLLTAAGFDVEPLDWVDFGYEDAHSPLHYNGHCRMIASCPASRDSDKNLCDDVRSLVDPYGGDVDTAGSGSGGVPPLEADRPPLPPDPPDYIELMRIAKIERARFGIEYKVYKANPDRKN